jgi:predicted ATPase/DNA-binding XRE family transcriptional regulator
MENEERFPGSSDFGALLRELRLAAGLSQEALAERAGISVNGVSALERGYRRTPQRETLALLAEALALRGDERVRFEAAAARPLHGRLTSPLPLALTTFVGREKELDQIATLTREHRFVTVTGAGGVGKTQTALRVATALNEMEASLVFVGLAPIDDPAMVSAAVASALGLQEAPERALIDSLVAHLKKKPVLLILDNCEHVIEAAALLAERLLAACPRVRILATSREPLRAPGEFTFRLPSLREQESVALFSDRARAIDHTFSFSGENAPVVAGICRRLDGIPLAIELAAARISILSLKALARKLDDSLKLLTGGERIALPRQQTMRATIDWSYDLLSAAEQRLFERLSVFSGGCALSAAAAVSADDDAAEDIVSLLSSLVDKSLVSAELDEAGPRYRLPESFREYAREKLVARGLLESVQRRQAIVALELAEDLERVYDSQPDDVWRSFARNELDNWRAALRWAFSLRGEVPLAQRLVGALRVVWQFFAPLEGLRWLRSARELVDEQTPVEVLGSLSYAEAITAWTLRDHNAHLSRSEEAIAHYRAAGDALGAARAQTLLGHALISLGRAAQARPVLRASLAVARRTQSPRLIAYTLRCLGWDSGVNLGDIPAARAYYDEALQIYDALGAKLNAAFTLNDRSEGEACAGNLELALQYATEAVATLRTFDETPLVAQGLDNMALYLISLDRYDEAEAHAREALALARDYNLETRHLEFLAAQALQHLAAIATLRNDTDAQRAAQSRAHAARILGFVDARLAVMGAGRLNNLEQQEYDRVLTVLRAAFGSSGVVSRMSAGAALTGEEAVDEAAAMLAGANGDRSERKAGHVRTPH